MRPESKDEFHSRFTDTSHSQPADELICNWDNSVQEAEVHRVEFSTRGSQAWIYNETVLTRKCAGKQKHLQGVLGTLPEEEKLPLYQVGTAAPGAPGSRICKQRCEGPVWHVEL